MSLPVCSPSGCVRSYPYFVCTALLALPASAARWNVDPAASRLTFSAEQSGEIFAGNFPHFNSMINFDEAAPENGSIRISVDMTRLQVDGDDRMAALPTDDWLAIAKFPETTFASTSIRRTGIRQYAAQGRLTLHGVTREITLPFSLDINGNSAVARGEIILNRRDFNIGGGRWESAIWIAYPVTVHYEIHASPKRAD